jgi:hypothetical protein
MICDEMQRWCGKNDLDKRLCCLFEALSKTPMLSLKSAGLRRSGHTAFGATERENEKRLSCFISQARYFYSNNVFMPLQKQKSKNSEVNSYYQQRSDAHLLATLLIIGCITPALGLS